MLSVCEQEISGHTIKREAMARDLNRARRQINARAACAAARKLQKVCPHPAAYLQQPRPAETIEAHHGTHPRRILLITMSFNLVEEFARAEFMCLSVHSAARVFAPLLARLPTAVDFDERATAMLRVFDVAAHDLFGRAPSQQLASEHTAMQDQLAPIVERVPVVKHDPRNSALA